MHMLIGTMIVITTAVSLGTKAEKQDPEWLLNRPRNFQQRDMQDGGSEMQSQYDESIKNWQISHSTNNEVWYAMQLLFYGKRDGASIEIGAMGGTMSTRCETEELEKFHWQRVLVEANPAFNASLASLKKSFTVNAAICNSRKKLHYFSRNIVSYANGIAEFMNPSVLHRYYPALAPFALNKTWPSPLPDGVTEIQCIPMKTIIKASGISHFNLWVLDTEGSELSILKTVDWSSVIFDVIIVETEREKRPKDYAEEVTKFLKVRNYVLMTLKRGRNSWFRHKSFVTATKSPHIKPHMKFLKNIRYSEEGLTMMMRN